jgi:hypothetical protein
MAANTLSAWTQKKTGDDKLKMFQCTCLIDTANVVAWTYRTPSLLDTSKPWTLIFSADTATDTQATPLTIYGGYTTSSAITGTAAVTASNCVLIGTVIDDCCYTTPTVAKAVAFDPNSAVADVVTVAAVATGLKMKIPAMANYLFVITAGSGTLLGATVTFTIVQHD